MQSAGATKRLSTAELPSVTLEKDSGLRRGLPRGTPKSSCSRLEGQSKRRRNFKCLMATISSRTALIQDPTKTKPLVAPFLLIELVPMFCPHNPTL